MKYIRVPAIRCKRDHAASLKVLEKCLKSSDKTYVHAVAAVIADYEERIFPIDLPSALAAIEFRMEQLGRPLATRGSKAFIHRQTGIQRGRVTELIRGKRGLSKDMIRRLHYGLGIPLSVLIGPNPIKQSCIEKKP